MSNPGPSLKEIEGNLLYIDEGGNLVLDTIGKTNGQIQSGDNPQFLVKGAGAGGGPAIQPETGPAIKISAFPAASTNMGSSDSLTGLQGGANVNFSQAQIFTGQTGTNGTGITIKGGAGTAGNGGSCYIYGGVAGGDGNGGWAGLQAGWGAGNGDGGGLLINGGNAPGAGAGGGVFIDGGQATGLAGTGGRISFQGGGAGAGGTGGSATFNGGRGGVAGGNTFIYAGGSDVTLGNIILKSQDASWSIPTSSSGLPSGAIWSNSNVLTIVP